NRDSTGGWFFDGMTLPDYHVGDQVNPGSPIAEVIDVSHLEVYAQVGESDHSNLKPGEPVDIQVNALPGDRFTGKGKTLGAAPSSKAFNRARWSRWSIRRPAHPKRPKRATRGRPRVRV